MKCVCGYERISSDYELDERLEEDFDFKNGDEDFIALNITATYESEGIYYTNIKEAHIYACPKCGTLKMNI